MASWAFPVPLMGCRSAVGPPATAAKAAAGRPAAAPAMRSMTPSWALNVADYRGQPDAAHR
eukprot:9745642-Heterocapsa_arctica.AAC.1